MVEHRSRVNRVFVVIPEDKLNDLENVLAIHRSEHDYSPIGLVRYVDQSTRQVAYKLESVTPELATSLRQVPDAKVYRSGIPNVDIKEFGHVIASGARDYNSVYGRRQASDPKREEMKVVSEGLRAGCDADKFIRYGQ